MKKLNRREIKKLKEDLSYKPVLIWDKLSAAQEREVEREAKEYKVFLDYCLTERRTVDWLAREAGRAGFEEPCPGRACLVVLYRHKCGALAWLGRRPLSEGLRIVGSHIDCPRLDLKTRPLYEEAEMAFFKTQYYGGIKKYQWLARPLALIGVAVKPDGRTVEIEVGLKPDDPVFTVADLLPHLARKAQYEKKLSEAFEGEKLNVIIGSRPLGDGEVKDRFKLSLLSLLKERFDLSEADLVSAELEVVPAQRARDVGLDRALIGAYGHDDRVSVYTSFQAALEAVRVEGGPARPGICLFVDKEETGSDGSTGAQSRLLEQVTAQLFIAAGLQPSSWAIEEALFNSRALSADVSAAFDPDYPEVHEKRNAAFLGYGPCLVKYTGSGGKYSTNDANAEYLGWLRGVLDRARVIWQAGGLGKVDEGGGGTIAKYLARYGLEVVDFGVPVLGMHSPFELISKADLLMTRRAMAAFFKAE